MDNKEGVFWRAKRVARKVKTIKFCINHLRNTQCDRASKLIILVYHRVLPQANSNPLYATLPYALFARQLDRLAKKYPIISLSGAIKQCNSGQVKSKIQVVLTFDDGFADNYEIVYPVLKRMGLPAAYFIVADYVSHEKPLWFYEVIKILEKNKDVRKIKIADKIICQKIMQPRLSYISSVINHMKSLGYQERQGILDLLKEHAENKLSFDHPYDRCISWNEAREMSANGIEIGSHGFSHSSLAGIPFTEAAWEIKKGKEIIEENTQKSCLHFAFPFGSRKDYNQNLIDYLKEAGFQTCLLDIHGYNHVKKDAFCFKRIIMEENTNLNYLLG